MKRACLFVNREAAVVRGYSSSLCHSSTDRHSEQSEESVITLQPNLIRGLLKTQDYGFVLHLVSWRSPQELSPLQQDWLADLLRSQGISVASTLECRHEAADDCSCRRPLEGLWIPLIKAQQIDFEKSVYIGAGALDQELAMRLGLKFFDVQESSGWSVIADNLIARPRVGSQQRQTKETCISATVRLDGCGQATVQTGMAFFDHMIEQIARHSGMDIALQATGDLAVDAHHMVEDSALTLGAAIAEALGDRHGISRYAFVLPMDESKASCSIDLGGRPYLQFSATFERQEINGFPTEMVKHFFLSLAQTLKASIHLECQGENTHHMIEALFKALAKCLGSASALTSTRMPSTKGAL